MQNKKKIFSMVAVFLFFASFLLVNVVYAATSSKIAFCDYSGVRRTFMILGIVINIVKIVVPLILIITGMVTFSKTIISGKSEDMTASLGILAKKIIAGLVVFLIPGLLDFTFDSLIGADESNFTECANCLLDTENCTIPEHDPDTYTE